MMVVKELDIRPVAGVAWSEVLVTGGIALLDLACLGGFSVWSYEQTTALEDLPAQVWRITDAIFVVSMLYLMLVSGAYSSATLSNPFSQITRILVNAVVIALLEWGVLFGLDFVYLFDWPWSGPLNLTGAGVVALCLLRLATRRLLVHWASRGQIVRSVAIVGAGLHGRRLLKVLNEYRQPWTRIIGLFDDRTTRSREAGEFPVTGTVKDLIRYAQDYRVDEVLVALPWNAEQRLLDIFHTLKVIPANVRLAPDAIGHHFLDRGFGRLDGVPVYNIFRKPISGWGAFFKRMEDLLLGSLILVLISPIMLACALAIRLDSRGPIFFRQKRFGYNNRLIEVYKFRSMYHELRDESAARLATRNDPRITPVGAFMRKTSLDELPQLFNVLKGEMSLVGPRPHATQAKAAGRLYQEVVEEYAVRHKIKPGITGWAQVKGWRGETDTEEKIMRRVECDLYYMENWSLFLDVEILVRTATKLIGKDVY